MNVPAICKRKLTENIMHKSVRNDRLEPDSVQNFRRWNISLAK